MKKILLLLAFPILGLSAQIEGTWKLAPQAGALSVGPALNNLTWFSSSAGDVVTRACLFDDSITFAAGGNMMHYMNGSTWLEGWQGVPEGCGTPIAPHTGGAATYAFDAALGTLTVNGLGAHMGLAKVHNAGELTSPAAAVSTITYNVLFSNGGNTMTVQINFGPGWWQYVYQKTVVINPPTPNITFKVDMSQYTGPAFTTVNLNGTFNGWCGACNPMTDANMDGIWDVTLPIGPGAIEYKFTLDGWNGQEQFVGGETCTVTNGGFTNRSYTVTGDADLGVVCYNSCSACASDVSFEVDMTSYTGPAYAGVFMNGTFNGWNGTSNPMTDANMDGIWNITLPLPNGAMEYKFTLDGWNASEQFVGGEPCTITTGGFTNRFYTVAGAANVAVVCYESCAACNVGINELTSSAVEVYPNPTSGVMTVVSNASTTLSNITNIMGETVIALKGDESNINIESLNAGIYFLNFQVNGENQTIRIIRD
jgi:hypothetical protein